MPPARERRRVTSNMKRGGSARRPGAGGGAGVLGVGEGVSERGEGEGGVLHVSWGVVVMGGLGERFRAGPPERLGVRPTRRVGIPMAMPVRTPAPLMNMSRISKARPGTSFWPNSRATPSSIRARAMTARGRRLMTRSARKAIHGVAAEVQHFQADERNLLKVSPPLARPVSAGIKHPQFCRFCRSAVAATWAETR
jgi:hypothetical protein